jgi:hypothetical protein
MFNRKFFSNTPVEFSLNKAAQVVFVCDLFANDLVGGAELTTEALITSSSKKVAKLHSGSLTETMLQKVVKQGSVLVFGNWTQCQFDVLEHVMDLASVGKLKYVVLEYDFKICSYRSFEGHRHFTGSECNCATEDHGLFVRDFYKNASHVFWMSRKQQQMFFDRAPELTDGLSTVLSSVFSEETLADLKELRKVAIKSPSLYAYQGTGSWIKGCEETKQWLIAKRKPAEALPKLPYNQLLEKLARYKGFAFAPLGNDTCPRIVIEAKLLGCELLLNKNVLHADEDWFTGTIEDAENYLRSRPRVFWSILNQI